MEIREHELWFIYDTLRTIECEIGALERQEVWFVSDSRERLDTSLEIVGGLLGVQDDEFDDEAEQIAFEFYDDGEGVFDYLDSLGDDE